MSLLTDDAPLCYDSTDSSSSSLDSSIYAVYRPTISEFYYVSSLSSFSLLDELDPQESEDGDTYSSESGDFLPEITSAVEEAMSRFKEE